MPPASSDEADATPSSIVADVLVPVAVDTAYSYSVPAGLRLEPGQFVAMPLGTRIATGVVWATRAGAGDNLKSIGEAASRAARTRERATVGRSGVLPVLRKPHFGGGAAVASGARTAMRSTPPRGERVQRATQSMKSRNGCRSAGQSRISTTDFRLSPPPGRVAQTTPVAILVPKGAATN